MKSIRTLIGLCFAAVLLSVSANTLARDGAREIRDATEIWQAWSAEGELKLYPDSLGPIGIDLYSDDRRVSDGETLRFSDRGLGTLEFHAPFGNFERFLDGRLVFGADLVLEHDGNRIEIDRLQVAANPDDPHGLILLDGAGNVLFTASHVHVYTVPERSRLVMERMDVNMTAGLAKALGLPDWAGRFVGEFALDAQLHIPAGAKTVVEGGSCTDRPKWSTDGHKLDVSLIAIGQVADRGSLIIDGKDYEILTPSARLKNDTNLDSADVPWFQKFTGSYPPHNNDQHPYLIWNLYRVADGRLEQIGVSGVKHAFLTINVSCTLNCGSGGVPGGNAHILWPGCEDVYGVGNNDGNGDLGPRDSEINPRTGVFESTGSFFDQNGDGNQDNSSSAPGENRMKVLTTDLETPDADYFFESWYVIRDDTDIFNSMGYHPTTPVGSGTNWNYQLGPFSQGAAVDEWVAPGGTPESGEMNVLHQSQQVGHFKVLAKAEQQPDDRWRYTYVVMNFDVDHGIESFSVLASGPVDSIYFHDPDQDAANDWTGASGSGEIRFSAPSGNPLTWGTAYSFGFESSEAPVATDVLIEYGPTGPAAGTTLPLLGPEQGEDIFLDGFEASL